jgi:hypothetical protein
MPPAANNNPRGFWEAQELNAFHDELLAAAGSSWDDWTRLGSDWLATGVAGRFRARLLAFLEANFGGSHLFVIKDPRMCRVVPLWRSVLREFGATVRVVIPVRNPMEVAASLASRDGFSTPWSLLIWLRYVLDAERETRDLPRSIIRFRDLLHGRQQVLALMRRRLAIRWPRPVADARSEIDDFLSLAERHHSVDDRALDLRQDVPLEVRRAYEALGAIALDGETPQAHAELDRIRIDLDRAAAIFGPIVTDQTMSNRVRTAETDALRRSLEECVAQQHASQQELATARAALLERSAAAELATGELRDARAELAQRLADVQQLSGELSALRAFLEDRSSEVAHLRDELVRSEAARDASARESGLRIEALREVLANREADLTRLLPEIDYMLHSFSWRLTAPLRAVRGRLRPPAK